MADDRRVTSMVPRIPLRGADDLADRIRALRDDAATQGFTSLAYFLEIALNEAELRGSDGRAVDVESRD